MLADVLGTDDDLITRELDHSVDKSLLLNALTNLNGREKQIMEMRFG